MGHRRIKHRHLQVELQRRHLAAWGTYDQLRNRLFRNDIATQARQAQGLPHTISYTRVEPQGGPTDSMQAFFGAGDTYPLSIDGPRHEMHPNDGAYVGIVHEWPDQELAQAVNFYGRKGQFNTAK